MRSNSNLISTLLPNASVNSDYDPHLSQSELRIVLQHMIKTRWLDERLTALQRQGRIGFHVGSMGEEASIVAPAFASRSQDWIFPCYRELGAALIRGLDFQRFMDNMFGNANDVVKGRQMPDHYTSRKAHFVSISSPVGTQITQAVGFAWAAKLRGEDLATITYFGDGATSSSEFHAGLNFAGVFKIPTVFLLRNNGWAISVPASKQSATATFAEKAAAYGVEQLRVDGNDALALIWATRQALERGSRGEGATLIEAVTYPTGGHSTSDDPLAYRPHEELEAWMKLDPIERLRVFMIQHHCWSAEEEGDYLTAIEKEFREAVKIAEATEKPSLSSMFDDVFAELPAHLRDQREQLLAGPRAPKHH